MKEMEPKRILIIRLSAIGDIIHTLPCLNALRQRFPGAYIAWVVEDFASDLLRGHPQLDELFVAETEIKHVLSRDNSVY